MKLLLIEDEHRLADALSYLLKKSGYDTDIALDGETGIEMALTGIYDIIILDRMLPKLDGISILQEFRHEGFATPVLFLTAKDTLKDRVQGLDAGADDYLVKPFSSEELLARLRALSRRKNKELVSATITIPEMMFDPLRGEVTKENEIIQLSVKESLLLELLMSNLGQVITKERIFEKIWGYYSGTEIANVDLYIHYLRKKLNTTSIRTVRGVGYFFEDKQYVS